MINIAAPILLKFESRPSPLRDLSPNTRHAPQDFKSHSASFKLNPKTPESKLVHVRKSKFQKLKQTLQWRAKTQFPIVRVKQWRITSQKMLDSESELEIQIELQGQFKSLEDYDSISFPQSIYILKESLIGFERLCYHFGSFQVESGMIKFNEVGICKVWITKDCFSNEFRPRKIQNQREFILELCRVIKSRVTKSGSAKNFFQSIENCKYFFQAIGKLDMFTKQQIINVPSSLQILQDYKSPAAKKALNVFSNQHKQNLTVSTQVPTFLKKNKLKKKNSNETSTPSPKKNKALKKTGLLDRSFTNIHRKLSSFRVSKKQSSGEQSFKQQTTQNKSSKKGDQNEFSSEVSIRLILPTESNEEHFPSSGDLSFFSPKMLANPESQKYIFAQVSDIGSSEQHKSGISFNPSKSIERKKLDVSIPKIPLKQNQVKRLTGSLLPNQHPFLFNQRCSKEFNQNGERTQGLNYFDLCKLSPQIKQLKDKRKYSEDIDNLKAQAQEKTTKKVVTKVPSFLSSLKNQDKSATFLAKSPSVHVIGSSFQSIQKTNENKSKIYLRETLAVVGTDFGKSLKRRNQNNITLPIPETSETPREQPKQKPKPKKLQFLGRMVDESSDTEETEFQLEYGMKMKNQTSIRKEIMNILD